MSKDRQGGERRLVVERMNRLRWFGEERRRGWKWKVVARKRMVEVGESRKRLSEGMDELKLRSRRRKEERSSQLRLGEMPSRSGSNHKIWSKLVLVR